MFAKKALITVLGLLGFLLLGCSIFNRGKVLTPAPRHAWITRWLQNPVCSPPCWEGITPGITTLTDTIRILNNMSGVSKVEDTDGILTDIPLRWNFDQLGGEGTVEEDKNGYITRISIAVAAYNQLLTIGEVISTYGPPSHVQRGSQHMSQSGFYVIYMEKGLYLYTILNVNNSSVKVTRDTRVLEIDFIQPGKDFFVRMVGSSNYFYEWKGYTSYVVR